MTNRLLILSWPHRWLVKNSRTWMPALIIVGTLLLSAILATRPSLLYMIGIGGLVFGAATFLILMRWPPIGLIAMIPGSLIIAFSIGAGSDFSSIHVPFLLLSLLFGLWILGMILRREIRLVSSRTWLPLLVYALVQVLAFGFGQLPWYSFPGAPLTAQLGGLLIMPFSAIAFLLVGHQIRDVRWLEWLTWTFIIVGGFYMVVLFIPPLENFLDTMTQPGMNGRPIPGFYRRGITAGSLFWTWLVALAFSQAIYNHKLHLVWRIALGGLVAATLFHAVIGNREWASGWIPPVIAIATILWVSTAKYRILVTLGTVVAMYTKLESFMSKIVYGENAYSTATRLEAYGIVLNIAKVNPILGLGPSNYYAYSERFGIRGYYVNINSHSNYVDIIAQTGLLGLACFFWFFTEILLLGWRLRTKVPEGFSTAYVYGALGGTVAMLVAAALGDWVLPFVYNVGLEGFRSSVLGWMFLGGLVALEQISQGSAEAKEEVGQN